MKEFEIVCPLTREPRLREIEAKAGGLQWVLKKRSIDARKEPVWRYRYEAYSPEDNYQPYRLPEDRDVHGADPVLIVGAGPAGMFAALKLITLGLRPVILERGKDVHARKADMAAINLRGEVNPDSNYCYGEGGAGAFSDGKLYTRSSKRGDIREVLHNLVRFGASSSILSTPTPISAPTSCRAWWRISADSSWSRAGNTISTPRVAAVERLPDGGFVAHGFRGELFGSAADPGDRTFRPRRLRDAAGHGRGAGGQGLRSGVRVEHQQEKINWNQYHGQWKPGMPAAEYSFVEQIDGRGAFSFCMCPGGILVPSSTEAGTVVLNGMSNSARSGQVRQRGSGGPDRAGGCPRRRTVQAHGLPAFGGAFDVRLELSAGASNPMTAPAQRMEDFCNGRMSKTLPETTYRPGAVSAPLHDCCLPWWPADCANCSLA